jgi:LysR family cys regulon transcriptional activator
MKLQQLRYVCEVAQRHLNVSEAADILHTSQPGVSKQIRQLESELGVPIFTRTGKRLAEVTQPGKAILEVADRILQEVENLKKISGEFTNEDKGTLSIATTHTQARYTLPQAIKTFSERYPNVNLRIHQGNPTQVSEMAELGVVDFAIISEIENEIDNLITLPCFQWNHCMVMLRDHQLLQIDRPLTLRDIANYPIVTYDFSFTDQAPVNKAFKEQNIKPNVVLTALDADVIKTYVELGLGIGLLAQVAYERHRDIYLREIDVGHLFEPSTTCVCIRRGAYLRGYMFEFIELFSPHLTPNVVKKALNVEESY